MGKTEELWERCKVKDNSEQDWKCSQSIPCLKAGSAVRCYIILDRCSEKASRDTASMALGKHIAQVIHSP